MLFAIDGIRINGLPRKRQVAFHVWRGRLDDDDFNRIVAEINRLIDEKLDESIVVSSFLPGSNWIGTVWEPLYTACGCDEQASGWFFGLIVWQVMIDRPETWYFTDTNIPDREILGKTYFRPETDRD